MTEAERARELADVAEREGYIDVSESMPDEAEDLRIWLRGARLLAAVPNAPSFDLMNTVADAIDGIEIVSRFNDWTEDRVEGFPIEILDCSGADVSGEAPIISRHRAEEDERACREAAECAARAAAAFDAIDRAGFAVVPKLLIHEVEAVVATFEADEAAGYRSKDRQFAVDVLGTALRLKAECSPTYEAPATREPPSSAVDVAALRLQAAIDAMEFTIDDGDTDFLKAWLEGDVALIRRNWPKFDLSSLKASNRAGSRRAVSGVS